MGLVITINPEVKSGKDYQEFEIEHKGETLRIKFFKVKSNFKLSFDNPNFRVTWFQRLLGMNNGRQA